MRALFLASAQWFAAGAFNDLQFDDFLLKQAQGLFGITSGAGTHVSVINLLPPRRKPVVARSSPYVGG
jgi:hypothetical protein